MSSIYRMQPGSYWQTKRGTAPYLMCQIIKVSSWTVEYTLGLGQNYSDTFNSFLKRWELYEQAPIVESEYIL